MFLSKRSCSVVTNNDMLNVSQFYDLFPKTVSVIIFFTKPIIFSHFELKKIKDETSFYLLQI